MNHLEIMEQDGMFITDSNSEYGFIQNYSENKLDYFSHIIMSRQTNDWY